MWNQKEFESVYDCYKKSGLSPAWLLQGRGC